MSEQKLYELIGKEDFKNFTDSQLEKTYRIAANKELHLKYPNKSEAMRSALKRIRNKFGLPSSAAVKEKRSG